MKVQRPGVLETVTIDLFIIRRIGTFLKRFPDIPTDFVALLDEWAERFFEELDYVREGDNATRFAAQMQADLPQARARRPSPAAFARKALCCACWVCCAGRGCEMAARAVRVPCERICQAGAGVGCCMAVVQFED